jgi:hypothetical protein
VKIANSQNVQRLKKKREEYPEQHRTNLDARNATNASFVEEHSEQHRTNLDARNATNASFREEHSEQHRTNLDARKAERASFCEEHYEQHRAMLDELSARYNQFKEEYPEEHRNNLDKRRSKRAKTTTIISEKRLTDKYIHHAETRVASFTLVFDEHAKLHTKHADAPSHVDAVAFARGSDHLRACNLRNLKKPRVTMPATHSSEYEIPTRFHYH